MLSLKAILIIILLTGLMLVSYMRDRYKHTISILGPSMGWRAAFASAYPLLSKPLNFNNWQTPEAITWWMENGNQPTTQDAKTITNLIDNNNCTKAQAWEFVRCNIQVGSGGSPVDCSENCHESGGPDTGKESAGQQILDGVFQYGLPILNTGLMMFG